MAKSKLGLTKSAVEVLSYIINENPVLKAEIDLPIQGDPNALGKIGELIINNNRFKNAFLNTVNVIALTVIRDNTWRNPWDEFTEKGVFRYGESVRELFVDMANVYDYHTYATDVDHFLENVVPNVYNYIHLLNYEKFYKTSTSDEQIAMAFTSESEFFNLIEKIVGSLYNAYHYDKYIVEKYMLCRRALDGTMATAYNSDWATLSSRERVAFMKSYSNKLLFPNPAFNPAGVKSFARFEDQYLILDTEGEASLTTEVLATSFFRNDAEFKTNEALIDSFSVHDSVRLAELLGNSYSAFTEDEVTLLGAIKGILIGRNFFQVYNKAFDTNAEVRSTMWENPETLKTNHWLHTKKVMSTSPFEPGIVFTSTAPNVTAIDVSPSSATISAGMDLQLSATVTATGFANKAVVWSVDSTSKGAGVTIDVNGKLHLPADLTTVETITVTATSVYKSTVTDTATITNGSYQEPTPTPTVTAPNE
jgi:hypothetical protein